MDMITGLRSVDTVYDNSFIWSGRAYILACSASYTCSPIEHRHRMARLPCHRLHRYGLNRTPPGTGSARHPLDSRNAVLGLDHGIANRLMMLLLQGDRGQHTGRAQTGTPHATSIAPCKIEVHNLASWAERAVVARATPDAAHPTRTWRYTARKPYSA